MSITKLTEKIEIMYRLIDIIAQTGLSKKEIAEKLGVSAAHVTNLTLGKAHASQQLINSVNRIWPLGISLAGSMGPQKNSKKSAGVNRLEGFDLSEAAKRVVASSMEPGLLPGYVQIPLYDVQASADGGTLVESELVVDFMLFKDEWVRKVLRTTPKNLALIGVTGDSMESTLSDGDVVLVDTSNQVLAINAIYVLYFCGALQVKRIQRKLDGSAVVISDNSVYGPETVSAEMVEKLQVVGRVVWYGRKG